MNKVIKKEKRAFVDNWWLKSYHLFSFSSYYDPENVSFWNLRVFNDDYIEAKTGFWLHPHENMEILTIILKWELTHWDNMWNNESIKVWEIQTMTAWTWILHSEENKWNIPVHLFQLWFLTNKIWHKPSYKNNRVKLYENSLNLIASWEKDNNAWFLNSDIKVYWWKYSKWNKFEYEIEKWRWLFIYIINWELEIENLVLTKEDQIRYEESWNYNFFIKNDSDFILINVKI